MAKKVVSLYIDDTSLRLMVTQGSQIRDWAETPLKPGLVKNAVILNEALVAANIKSLFKIQRLKARKILVGISGLHCLSRSITLPQLPRTLLSEAVMREAKRVLPVPSDQLYISWQPIPAPEGKVRVFLMAIPRKAADALFTALHQAGLKPYLLDIKPLLLAKVVKRATAIIMDVQATEFDIVVLIDGIPELIRTIAFPSETLGSQEKLQVIKDELSRTIQFYNVNNQETPITSSIPVFVSGELVYEPRTYQAVSDELGYPVSPLPSPLDCPPWLDVSRYFINIGLALQGLLSRNGEEPSVVHLNAMPSRYRAKPPSLAKRLILPIVLAAIALITFMVMRIEDTYGDSALVRQQMNVLNQQLIQTNNERQALIDEIAALEANLTGLETSRSNFAEALSSLESQKDGINRTLQAIVENLPGTITLTNITYANNSLTVVGKSQDEQEVFDYLNQLDSDDKLGEMTLTKLSKGKDEAIDFTLVISWGGQD